eukprot:1777485-Rhodomonas_salina.1
MVSWATAIRKCHATYTRSTSFAVLVLATTALYAGELGIPGAKADEVAPMVLSASTPLKGAGMATGSAGSSPTRGGVVISAETSIWGSTAGGSGSAEAHKITTWSTIASPSLLFPSQVAVNLMEVFEETFQETMGTWDPRSKIVRRVMQINTTSDSNAPFSTYFGTSGTPSRETKLATHLEDTRESTSTTSNHKAGDEDGTKPKTTTSTAEFEN